MDIIHLLYFTEVARQESFTKASEVLYVSQSTISKLIKNLERELGVALFHRAPKRVILTDAGLLLFEKAKIILDTLNSINSELYNLAGTPSGHLKIGISPMVQTLFPKAIAEFSSLYPQITIDLVEVGSRKVEERIHEGILDVGIVVLPTRTKVELETVPFLKDPLMLIVDSNHHLAAKSIIDIRDLQEESFVLYRDDFALHDHILDKCKELGFAPKIVCETAQWDFMVDIVASKLAIAFLPQTVCAKLDLKSITCLPLKNDIKPWHLAIAWKRNTYLSYATRAWLEYTFKMFSLAK
ncbi:MAG: transcriptional regulator, LysR family [Pelosinus sp.]|jgi:DNA-binding transcriptional LysR family regulator|nr:transcriptional regulator, LysR family [Pelosinus sp.]